MVTRGLVDTSLLIDNGDIDPETLPDEMFISAISLAELASGPHAAKTEQERAIRQYRLQWAEASFVSLPVDARVARAYGLIYAAARRGGRRSKRRVADYLIAATAAANALTLYTKNPRDFAPAASLVKIIAVLPTKH
jgi:predicted nucleic acid-binding protein